VLAPFSLKRDHPRFQKGPIAQAGEGLFRRLPEAGTEWNVTARAKWLETAVNIFDLIYEGEGGIKIEAAMAARSPRPRVLAPFDPRPSAVAIFEFRSGPI
jgi:hypothetical protein